MKKTIASAALLASATSAFAIVGPMGDASLQSLQPVKPLVEKNFCLSLYEDNNGEKYVSDCDESLANKKYGLELGENGCAEGQVSFRTIRNIEIKACPTFVQL